MPRRGPLFTTSDAERIADKLEAVIEQGRRPHALAIVYHRDQRIVQFGIRRGSRDQGHGHLPSALHLSPHHTRRLADCPMSYEEWISVMSEKGLIAEEN